MIRMVFIVVALLTSTPSAHAQKIATALLGLWAKEARYCQTLLRQGDLTKLNGVFDYQYILFKDHTFHMDESSGYQIVRSEQLSRTSGTIIFNNDISPDIGEYRYSIESLHGDTVLKLTDSFGQRHLFYRC